MTGICSRPIVATVLFGVLVSVLLQVLRWDDYGEIVCSPSVGDVGDLPAHLQDWYRKGTAYRVLGHQIFAVFDAAVAQGNIDRSAPLIILMHGFPSSSFEFHKVIPLLRSRVPSASILAADLLGYGFSEKPNDGTRGRANRYSIFDLAEVTMALWSSVVATHQLTPAAVHVISHDVGNTVLSEILARVQRRAVPDFLETFINSVVFTNGGIVYAHSAPRIGQKLLSSSVGGLLHRALLWLDPGVWFLKNQLRTVWATKGAAAAARERDIDDMVHLLVFGGGYCAADKMLWYIRERQTYERRWHDAVAASPLPFRCVVVWGDDDAVAPIAVAHAFSNISQHQCALHVVAGAGHFLQLERPKEWVDHVVTALGLS